MEFRCPHCGSKDISVSIGLTSSGQIKGGGITADCNVCRRSTRLSSLPGLDSGSSESRPSAPASAPAPTRSEPPRAEMPAGPDPLMDLDEAFIEVVSPNIYRTNPFRIAGLPVTATAREIARQLQKVTLAEKLGSDTAPAAPVMPVDPPPSAEEVKTSLNQLRDPAARLVSELFWFWDDPRGGAALADALQTGDMETADAEWQRRAAESDGDIALHNLAVYEHALALDSDADSATVDRDSLAQTLASALRHWGELFSNEHFWRRLGARALELDDPRLTAETAPHMRRSLPLALALISASACVRYADAGDFAHAKRHKKVLEKSGLDRRILDEAYRRATEPVVRRLETMCKDAEKAGSADPLKADDVAERLLDNGGKVLDVLRAALPRDSSILERCSDEVALGMLQSLILFGNRTDRWARCKEVLSKATQFAASESAKSRITETLRIVDGNERFGTCWFCEQNPAVEKAYHPVTMFGDVTRNPTYNGVRVEWKKNEVKVPRCEACRDAHTSAEATGCLGAIFGVVAFGAGFFVPDPYGGWLVTLGLSLFVLLVITVRKGKLGDARPATHAQTFPVVKELQAKGWQFGAGPAQ
jgi:hypothetical protein